MPAITRNRISLSVALLVFAALSCGPALAAGQQQKKKPASSTNTQTKPASVLDTVPTFTPTPGYSVKPSEVVVPGDVAVGRYRRTFQPFPNWTLICDENLAKKRKVCNIAQTILGSDGAAVFSWSLAASQDGQPLFILRAPPALGADGTIALAIPDGGPLVRVKVRGCDATVCLAYQPVGQRLRAAVEKGLAVEISYAADTPSTPIVFRVPLQGLAQALAAI